MSYFGPPGPAGFVFDTVVGPITIKADPTLGPGEMRIEQFDAAQAIDDDVNRLVERGEVRSTQGLVYVVNEAQMPDIQSRRIGKAVATGHWLLLTSAGQVEVVSDRWFPSGSVYRMWRCPCGVLFIDNTTRSGKCAACQRASIERDLAGDYRAPIIEDGRVLRSRPGEKHGPNATGAAGPCDPDCLKCKNEAAAKAIAPTYAGIPIPICCGAFMQIDASADGVACRKCGRRLCVLQSQATSAPLTFERLQCCICGKYDRGSWECDHKKAPTVETPWMRADAPARDPLDLKYDGVTLRALLQCDANRQRETVGPPALLLSPVQRAAISAHWSAELRARIAAAKERDRNQVTVDNDEE